MSERSRIQTSTSGADAFTPTAPLCVVCLAKRLLGSVSRVTSNLKPLGVRRASVRRHTTSAIHAVSETECLMRRGR